MVTKRQRKGYDDVPALCMAEPPCGWQGGLSACASEPIPDGDGWEAVLCPACRGPAGWEFD